MQTYHTLVGYNKGRLYIKNHCKTIFGDRVLRRHFWYVRILGGGMMYQANQAVGHYTRQARL